MLDYLDSLQPAYQEKFGIRFVYPTDEWYLVSGRELPPLAAYDGHDLYENGLGMVRRFLNEWEEVKGEIRDWQAEGEDDELPSPVYGHGQTLTLVTGTLFAPVLTEVTAEFASLTGTTIQVLPAKNETLGESITVAGLLMAQDLINQLRDSGYGEMVVLPRVVFDHPDHISLDDLTPREVANALVVPVALADTMGDVWDALTGESLVVYQPEAT